MKLIKIYDKDFTKLVTLTDQDFTDLQHQRARGEIGDASFTVKLNRAKMNDVNLNLYNRVKVLDDGVVKFTGIITQKKIKLDTADIKVRELPFILKKRIVSNAYTLSGSVNDMVTQLIGDMNGVEDTGISLGSLTAVGSINLTFNSADVWTVLKQICDSTDNQFEIKDQVLIVAPTIGSDKSASVLFRYNVNQVANANLFSFEIEDDGENIVTLAHGKSDTLTSDQTDSALVTKFGTLEKFRDFRVINTQGVLDEFTETEVADRIYSPKIALKPNVTDDFEVGDIVKIKLKNPLIDLNDNFQIIQKQVKYNGEQKMISVRINDLPSYLVQKLAERDKRLELLEKQL